MAERKINRTFLLLSFALLCVKHSTGKSVVVDLNLAPEWKREITQRASDYGKMICLFLSLQSIPCHHCIILKLNCELSFIIC